MESNNNSQIQEVEEYIEYLIQEIHLLQINDSKEIKTTIYKVNNRLETLDDFITFITYVAFIVYFGCLFMYLNKYVYMYI